MYRIRVTVRFTSKSDIDHQQTKESWRDKRIIRVGVRVRVRV